MIANHAQFLAAIQDRKKVCVRFYSKPDNGVLDRVCVPLDYGLGADNTDELHRYWLWDAANHPGTQHVGLLPQQIVELTVLGEQFDPEAFPHGPTPTPTPTPVVATPISTPIL